MRNRSNSSFSISCTLFCMIKEHNSKCKWKCRKEGKGREWGDLILFFLLSEILIRRYYYLEGKCNCTPLIPPFLSYYFAQLPFPLLIYEKTSISSTLTEWKGGDIFNFLFNFPGKVLIRPLIWTATSGSTIPLSIIFLILFSSSRTSSSSGVTVSGFGSHFVQLKMPLSETLKIEVYSHGWAVSRTSSDLKYFAPL